MLRKKRLLAAGFAAGVVVVCTLYFTHWPLPLSKEERPAAHRSARVGGEALQDLDSSPAVLVGRQTVIEEPSRASHENVTGNAAGRLPDESWIGSTQRSRKLTTTEADGTQFVQTFSPDGKPWEEYQLDPAGKMHGEYRNWHPGGELSSVAGYDHGKLHGSYELYHPNGILSASGEYGKGVKTGTWKTWHNSGLLASEVAYGAGGKLDGLCLYYESSGEPDFRLTGYYEDGSRAD